MAGVNVRTLSTRVGMSRQNYYARRQHREARQADTEMLLGMVRAERQVQPRLGARKLLVVLADDMAAAGVDLGRDRFFKLLREANLLLAPLPGEYPRTTNSYHCLPVFKNLVQDLEVTQPNEVWVSDLTYLRTGEGFLYLALVTDCYSRKIVGYHCSDTLEAVGCLKALALALRDKPAWAKPIHHSDQGTQYCCHEYVNTLTEHGLQVSMTERNHCAENALAERMNGILKSEYGLGQTVPSKAQARALVEQAVHLYNTCRPHLSLAMQTPAEVYSQAAKN